MQGKEETTGGGGTLRASEVDIVRFAIERGVCVSATYNKQAVTLAPHVLYTKHEVPYLDAVTIERDGEPPKVVKMGAYKCDGLRDLALTAKGFSVSGEFNPSDAKYGEAVLARVKR